jgi:hypothetical protein
MHTFWDQLGQALAQTILALAVYVAAQLSGLLQRDQRSKPHKPLEQSHNEDLQIKLRLERVREHLGADRAYLSQYSNGEKYLSHRDIVKKSRTHEVTRQGFSYQQDQFKGVLVSDIPDETNLVMQDGPSFTLVETLPLGRFRWLCEQGGAKAIARCAIHRGKEIVGFVGADFGTDCCPANIDELCKVAYEIGQILTVN